MSPDVERRRQEKEADINDVLAQSLDSAELGEAERCLSEREYRSFRALDNRRLLFIGRRDQYWINTLRTRCPDLRDGSVLVVRSFSSRRLCSTDTFQVADWFYWPWYRRWPWRWASEWGTGAMCVLGEFQPVTAGQVAEIEAIIRAR